MFNEKTILSIIPARGRSKGITGKNIKLLCDKPLIAWTIESALHSKYIDRIIVSTDSDKIKGISEEWGAQVPFKRPSELATDEAPTIQTITHTLDWIKTNEKREYDFFILLQPTSPLRTHNHIDNSIEKLFSDSNALSLVSVAEVKTSPYWMKTINNEGYLENFVQTDYSVARRQDLPKVYQVNGAIYMTSTELFCKKQTFYNEKTSYYIMDPNSSIDIDTELDFIIAETLLSK